MKKRIALIVSMLTLALLMVACGSKEYTEKDYDEAVKSFKTIEAKDVNKKIANKEDFVLYLGRKNCPYCVKLAPDFKKIAKDLKVDVLYMDTLETNDEMDKFFKNHKLEYVPSILVFKKGVAEEVKLNHTYAKEKGKYPVDEVKKELEAKLAK